MRDMTFRRHWASVNLNTFLYILGDKGSNLSSTCDVPGTVLDFLWIISFHLYIYFEGSVMILII